MASKPDQSILGRPLGLAVGLAVRFMVETFFIGFGSSSHDDAYPVTPVCVGDVNQPVVDHAQQGITIFAVIFALIVALDPEGIVEGEAGSSEADLVVAQVGRGLPVIPLEFIILHIYGLAAFYKAVERGRDLILEREVSILD